jgi:hypothetical protein
MILIARQLGASGAQISTTAVQGGGAIATALAPASALPIIGAAVVGVTLALGLIFSRKGPKQKVAATKIVEELEPQLQANLDGYMSGPRTRSSQAAALANFDAAWAYLSSAQACGSPDLGNPGKACLADRGHGGKFDWFVYFRDPIANDPNVQPDPLPGSELLTTIQQATNGVHPALLLAGGALLLGAIL